MIFLKNIFYIVIMVALMAFVSATIGTMDDIGEE